MSFELCTLKLGKNDFSAEQCLRIIKAYRSVEADETKQLNFSHFIWDGVEICEEFAHLLNTVGARSRRAGRPPNPISILITDQQGSEEHIRVEVSDEKITILRGDEQVA